MTGGGGALPMSFTVVASPDANRLVMVGTPVQLDEAKRILAFMEDGRPAGLFVELAADVAERQGWQLQFEPVSWDQGLRMLQECGVKVAVITGRESELVKHRMNDLGVTLLYQGYRDKTPAFETLLKEVNLSKDQITYVGDDVVDLPIMSQLDFAIAVQNAHPFVKQHAHWITDRSGGHGAARDVCEFILEAKGLLNDKLHSYLYSK